MKALTIALAAAACAALAPAASAQSGDFSLTYHVERTPASRLSIAACGRIASDTARQSRLTADAQSFPGQLVMVKGGSDGAGAFVVQCIAVGSTTVSVVQGIDYGGRKGALGNYADKTLAALKLAAK